MKVYSVLLPDLANRADLIERYEEMLSSSELERYQKMTDGQRRLQFLAGRALIRAVFHQSPRVLENGKPVVNEAYISLAHSGPHVLLAVADSPAGIDIEDASKQKDFKQLSKRLGFHLSGDERLSFFRQFTRYEADYKLGEKESQIYHFYYSIDTFIICVSILNKKENIYFIKTVPFVSEAPLLIPLLKQEI